MCSTVDEIINTSTCVIVLSLYHLFVTAVRAAEHVRTDFRTFYPNPVALILFGKTQVRPYNFVPEQSFYHASVSH